MCEIIPFKREHLLGLLDQKINRNIREWALGPGAKAMESVDSVTVLYKGEIMLCGGINQYWEGRGCIWSVFSEHSKHHFVSVLRTIRRWIYGMLETKYFRIEMSVTHNFFQGHRRAQLLGFNLEIPLAKRYTPSGTDSSVYALVRRD